MNRNPTARRSRMNMIALALAMLAMPKSEGKSETKVIPDSIALGSYGGNPEAGNYFRTRNSAHKKTNRLQLSRKAKIRRRKSA